MIAITISSGSQPHFDVMMNEDIIGEQDSFCWPAGNLREYYFSSPTLVRHCLGVEPFRAEGEAEAVELNGIYEATDEAISFLANHDFLFDLLEEAVPYVKRHFGNDVRVRLELFVDPSNGNDPELFARVLTQLRADDALDLLDRFDEEWWLESSPRSKCLLTFALRYV